MKRLISFVIALILVVGLSACAPNNVLSAQPQQTPDTSEKPQENTPEPEKTPDTSAPTTENENAQTPVDDGFIIAGKEKNKKLMPTLNVDTLGIAPVKLSTLAGKVLTIYTAERDAFAVDKKSDKEWINEIAAELELKVKQFKRSDKTLYSAQAIAQKSGMSLDIVSTLISDIIPTRTLMKQAVTLTDDMGAMPFSKRVHKLSGGKVFTGNGNSKMMWYNTDIVSDQKAYDLFEQGLWNTGSLAVLGAEITTAQKNIIECSNWAAFASAGGKQITGLGEDGKAIYQVGDETSINTLKTFSDIFKTVSADKKTFKNGNTAFCFTDAPTLDKGSLGFVPIPAYKDGNNVTELCGVGMGVSKTADDIQSQYALTFILLWSARYSEARADALVYDYKLDEKKAEKYIEFSESNGGLYNADIILSQDFAKSTIPHSLFSTPETILEKYADSFNRVALINNRNQ